MRGSLLAASIARSASNRVTWGVAVIVRKSTPAKGSAGGASTMFSERSIRRIELSSMPVVADSAPTIPHDEEAPQHGNEDIAHDEGQQAGQKGLRKFIFKLFYK